MQTRILSKFYTEPPLGEIEGLAVCGQPRVEFMDDGTPVMPNEEWLTIYKSCVDAVKARDAALTLITDWIKSEITEQELNNALN